ncbi:MAG: hypothetical protein AAF437_11595 [Pseudomonadota bacterium]
MTVFKHVFAALASACMFSTFSGFAFAESDFCGSDNECQNMGVYNRSAALVTSVVITQEKTDGACALDERTYSQNLTGVGGANMDGDGFTVSVSPNCQYKIKFKTTSGCTGDKTTHLTPSNFENGKQYVELKGGCGSLDTRKG